MKTASCLPRSMSDRKKPLDGDGCRKQSEKAGHVCPATKIKEPDFKRGLCHENRDEGVKLRCSTRTEESPSEFFTAKNLTHYLDLLVIFCIQNRIYTQKFVYSYPAFTRDTVEKSYELANPYFGKCRRRARSRGAAKNRTGKELLRPETKLSITN